MLVPVAANVESEAIIISRDAETTVLCVVRTVVRLTLSIVRRLGVHEVHSDLTLNLCVLLATKRVKIRCTCLSITSTTPNCNGNRRPRMSVLL